MKIYIIVMALYVSMIGISQSESFEKQALGVVQRMLAYELDSELPRRPIGIWFKQLVGPQAGVIWQLTECGEPINSPGEAEPDIPACVEANAVLPDGSKVVVAITVGTFKKGLTGQPAFFRAVVEQNYQLNLVRRLHELPVSLRGPETPSIQLPKIVAEMLPVKMIAYNAELSLVNRDFSPTSGEFAEVDVPLPPQPKPEEPQKLKQTVLLGSAITVVMPAYPANARGMNAYGEVEVEITVSEEGMVTEAKAISGHTALHNAAVDAARRWIFKPSTLNGVPVQIRSVLTFVFTPRTQ